MELGKASLGQGAGEGLPIRVSLHRCSRRSLQKWTRHTPQMNRSLKTKANKEALRPGHSD